MRVIPVLDLKDGQVVRGVGGRRDEYRPVVSQLTSSSQPLDVARAIHEHFGLTEFYVADLDALASAPPHTPAYQALRAAGFRLWVDAGLRTAGDADALADAGVEVLIAGLETLHGPEVLAALVARFGAERVHFSLDLKDGQPLGDLTRWRGRASLALAAAAVAVGVRRLLILDLARVGGGAGTGTNALATEMAARYPNVRLAVGGGVRDANDLRELARTGIDVVLVASALHDGRIRPHHLAGL